MCKNTRRSGKENNCGESSIVLMTLWVVALMFALGMYFVGRMSLESDMRGRCYKSNLSGKTFCDQAMYRVSDESIKRIVNGLGAI